MKYINYSLIFVGVIGFCGIFWKFVKSNGGPIIHAFMLKYLKNFVLAFAKKSLTNKPLLVYGVKYAFSFPCQNLVLNPHNIEIAANQTCDHFIKFVLDYTESYSRYFFSAFFGRLWGLLLIIHMFSLGTVASWFIKAFLRLIFFVDVHFLFERNDQASNDRLQVMMNYFNNNVWMHETWCCWFSFVFGYLSVWFFLSTCIFSLKWMMRQAMIGCRRWWITLTIMCECLKHGLISNHDIVPLN